MVEHDLVVVGGGFAGIYAAWRLARAGQRVALVEAGHSLGGSLASQPWRGFDVDNGAHNLDLRSPAGQAFYGDILGDGLAVIEGHTWGSCIDGPWTEGFEFPDLSGDPALCAAALSEMETLRQRGDEDALPQGADTSWLVKHASTRGPALTRAIAPMLGKVAGTTDPGTISRDAARSLGMFNRPRLGSDAVMLALKHKARFWDDRLGVTLHCGDPAFLPANTPRGFGYPRRDGTGGGLSAFGRAAARRLADMGVTLLTGRKVTGLRDAGGQVTLALGDESVSAARAFWSLPERALLPHLGIDPPRWQGQLPVGCAFFAFEVDADAIAGPHYLHDYNPARLPFRYSSPGLYGDQINADGRTLVIAEVPAHPATLSTLNSDWAARACWTAMLETGYLRPSTVAHASLRWGVPVAFTLPLTGWRPVHAEQERAIAERAPRVTGIDFGYRGRAAFMAFCETKLLSRLLDQGPAT